MPDIDLIYNFNENSATTIRDYSDGGGMDGTGTNLTIASSTRVGYDAVFNSTTDQISMGNVTHLNGKTEALIHLAINRAAMAGNAEFLNKSGQISVSYDNAAGTIVVDLTVASGTAQVSTTVTAATWYDIMIDYASDVLTLYKDGSSVDADDTQSGAIVSNANTMYLGDTGGSDSALFNLNELKIYTGFDPADTANRVAAWVAEQNGVLTDSGLISGFSEGDIIGGDLTNTPMYAVVGFVGTGAAFRVYPITANFRVGIQVQRVGHLWDTSRQYALRIQDNTTDDTTEVYFYDGMSQTSEVFTAEKEITKLDKNGLFEKRTDISTTYTVLDNDRLFVVDLSGGAFTATLPSSPIENKRYLFKDNGSANGSNKLTLAGNGNNIDGAANVTLLNSAYESKEVFFDGTEWFII